MSQFLTMKLGILSAPDVILSFNFLKSLIMSFSVIASTRTFLLLNVVKSGEIVSYTFEKY